MHSVCDGNVRGLRRDGESRGEALAAGALKDRDAAGDEQTNGEKMGKTPWG